MRRATTFQIVPQIREHLKIKNGCEALNVPRAIIPTYRPLEHIETLFHIRFSSFIVAFDPHFPDKIPVVVMS
jgi:hypothetical protein